jgi:hypothetical protein
VSPAANASGQWTQEKIMEHHRERLSPAEEWKYAERSLAWHGWGSPVGLGFVLVCLGVTAVLARLALLGF